MQDHQPLCFVSVAMQLLTVLEAPVFEAKLRRDLLVLDEAEFDRFPAHFAGVLLAHLIMSLLELVESTSSYWSRGDFDR